MLLLNNIARGKNAQIEDITLDGVLQSSISLLFFTVRESRFTPEEVLTFCDFMFPVFLNCTAGIKQEIAH